MKSEENAILTMFKAEFLDLIVDKILKTTYDSDIYPIISLVAENKALFDASYIADTNDSDFYVLKSTVTTANRTIIKGLLGTAYYNAQFMFGFPLESDISNNSLICLFHNSWGDNLENSRIGERIDVNIYADINHYKEGAYISRVIKSIKIFSSDQTVYSGWYFLKALSAGEASKMPENYMILLHTRQYYPFRLIFELKYEEDI